MEVLPEFSLMRLKFLLVLPIPERYWLQDCYYGLCGLNVVPKCSGDEPEIRLSWTEPVMLIAVKLLQEKHLELLTKFFFSPSYLTIDESKESLAYFSLPSRSTEYRMPFLVQLNSLIMHRSLCKANTSLLMRFLSSVYKSFRLR